MVVNRHICWAMTRLQPQNPELAQSSSSILHFSILVGKFYSQTIKTSIL